MTQYKTIVVPDITIDRKPDGGRIRENDNHVGIAVAALAPIEQAISAEARNGWRFHSYFFAPLTEKVKLGILKRMWYYLTHGRAATKKFCHKQFFMIVLVREGGDGDVSAEAERRTEQSRSFAGHGGEYAECRQGASDRSGGAMDNGGTYTWRQNGGYSDSSANTADTRYSGGGQCGGNNGREPYSNGNNGGNNGREPYSNGNNGGNNGREPYGNGNNGGNNGREPYSNGNNGGNNGHEPYNNGNNGGNAR